MARSLTDATLALAGVFQAAGLVHEVALRGSVDRDRFECSMHSIFEVDPPDTVSVYGGIERLAEGLKLLRQHLGGSVSQTDLQVAKYAVAVLHLQGKLVKRQDLMARLGAGIERIRNAQLAHFPVTHENVVAAVADLYVETVSTLTPRIIVAGEHGHLSQPANANRVRALLLAAIRSAVLFRQNGGTRLRLLFGRGRYTGEAARLLDAIGQGAG